MHGDDTNVEPPIKPGLAEQYFRRNRIFAGMKNALDLFTELGRRLARFGQDEASRRAAELAQAANGWFTSGDIRRAAAAVADGMLRRERLASWLSHYPVPAAEPRRVLVVMAGNIPLVGFFDLLCVVAAGHRCLVKPSSKDRPLLEYVVALLREIDPDAAVEFADGAETEADAVIATGSDRANRFFRTRYAALPALLRGSRQSVAVLSGRETERQLAGLADDLFAYSGLGCRSVSLVFLPRGCGWRPTPLRMNPKYCRNYVQTKAVLVMQGVPFRDLGAAVMVERRAFPTALSCICYPYYDDVSEVAAWLAEHDGELQCVVSECIAHSRRADFGCAQRPALTDYPDDRDVMEFLAGLGK